MKDAARKKLEELIERFSRNIDVYKSGSYNEAQVRREFIEPFFEALGWDVYNRQGYAEQYKDVVHEDSVKVGVSLKAPDYSFRIGGQRKFFLEAKKPSVSIKDDIDPAYQLRRYAWSAKLPLSILTDFEEFAVYDCRIKPSPRDKANTGRIAYYTCNRYIDEFDALYDVFSRDAVLKGSFDRYAVTTAGKRGSAEVDREFLKEIEGWRDSLARNIAIRNPELTVDEMNFSVQQTIDRIIFLRICEDRGIEPYGGLQALLNGVNTYRRLFELFCQADTKYNSGLFDFSADKLTSDIRIDDDAIKGIIDSLYYPKSPYEFSVLGADILGNVYEQFLGKVIRLTPSHQAKVEEKPEVKKAGGVYYTPEYIVEYIVKNTVGRLLHENPPMPLFVKGGKTSAPPLGKGDSGGFKKITPKEVSYLRILDPACGSGSFLIGAYQYLLDWHLKWYMENSPENYAKGKLPAVYKSGEGWRLTTQEKKRILLNNIYGVDIDRQAVEVTKLSLLLKVLEDENRETIGKNLLLFRERVLPNLDSNIKCGNSLIGTDFYSENLPLMGEDENLRKTNPFDWHDPEKGFGKIMKEGGFDAVIGNPPYVRIQAMKEWVPVEVELYKERYKTAQTGNYDIYVVFVEKGFSLLKKGGHLGYILPHKFFQAQYGEPLRKLITDSKSLFKIVDFTDCQIFEGASTYTNLLFLTNEPTKKFEYIQVKKAEDIPACLSESYKADVINSSTMGIEPWILGVQENLNLFKRVVKENSTLKDVCERIYQGMITSADPVFLFKDFKRKTKTHCAVFSKALDGEITLESVLLKNVIRSGDIGRYYAEPKALVLFPYKIEEGKASLIPAKEFERDYPLVWEYLNENKKILEEREHGKFKGSGWYQFGRTQNIAMWEQPKLMVPYMITRLSAYFDESDNYYFVNVTTGGYGITSNKLDLKYLTGLLNSKLVDFCLKQISTNFRGGYFAANKQFIERLPIRTIDFDNKKEKAMHDQVVSLVEKMLDLNEKLKKAKTPHDRELIERQIKATDSQIDKLVYELYGLTEEEIRIVQGGNNE